MKPLSVFIIEDEPLIASTIETALKKHHYYICGEADNANDALKGIHNLAPDLVLVDIQLEGYKTGIDVAIKLDELDIPYLYLTSQTDPKTILEIKQTQPLGYIAKPFTEAGLISSIEVAWNNYSKISQDYLLFSSNNQTHKVKQSQILYLKAFDNYCYIVTNTNKYLVPKTLKHLAKQINKELFVKTHRSYIVNITKITSLELQHVILTNIKIPLSQANKSKVKQLLKL